VVAKSILRQIIHKKRTSLPTILSGGLTDKLHHSIKESTTARPDVMYWNLVLEMGGNARTLKAVKV
jgi:hypothetical protein